MNNKVRPIMRLQPEKIRKMHYLFAYNDEDFANFTGSKPFELKQPIGTFSPTFSRKVYGSITDKYVYVYCGSPEDIRGLTKIEASLTNKFKSSVTPKLLAEIQAEIQICNFISNNHFNPEHVPNVLREMMAEMQPFDPENPNNLRFPCVGMVVKSKRDYAPIGVKKGDFGIIVHLCGPQLNDSHILFQNGDSSGFSSQEMIEDLEFFSLTTDENIKGYQFRSSANLYKHFEEGYFDSEFGDKY